MSKPKTKTKKVNSYQLLKDRIAKLEGDIRTLVMDDVEPFDKWLLKRRYRHKFECESDVMSGMSKGEPGKGILSQIDKKE